MTLIPAIHPAMLLTTKFCLTIPSIECFTSVGASHSSADRIPITHGGAQSQDWPGDGSAVTVRAAPDRVPGERLPPLLRLLSGKSGVLQ